MRTGAAACRRSTTRRERPAVGPGRGPAFWHRRPPEPEVAAVRRHTCLVSCPSWTSIPTSPPCSSGPRRRRAPRPRCSRLGLSLRPTRSGFGTGFWSDGKSVALLWATARTDQRAAIAATHRRAVEAALALMERAGRVVVRSGAGGTQKDLPSDFIAARSDLDTPREGDPGIHTHAVAMNVAGARQTSTRAAPGASAAPRRNPFPALPTSAVARRPASAREGPRRQGPQTRHPGDALRGMSDEPIPTRVADRSGGGAPAADVPGRCRRCTSRAWRRSSPGVRDAGLSRAAARGPSSEHLLASEKVGALRQRSCR